MKPREILFAIVLIVILAFAMYMLVYTGTPVLIPDTLIEEGEKE